MDKFYYDGKTVCDYFGCLAGIFSCRYVCGEIEGHGKDENGLWIKCKKLSEQQTKKGAEDKKND